MNKINVKNIKDFFIKLQNINNKNILIICNDYDQERLVKASRFLSIQKETYIPTFITKKEFIKRATSTIYDDAIFRVAKEFNYSFDRARRYLNNINNLIDDNKKISRIDNINRKKIETIKTFLINNNLIKVDSLFNMFVENKEIVSYNCYFSKLEEKMLVNKNITNYYQSNNINKVKVFEYNNLENEIFMCFESIASRPNRKSVIVPLEDVTYQLRKLSSFYNITLNNSKKTYLSNYEYGRKLIKEYSQTGLMQKPLNNYIYKAVISIINKAYFIPKDDPRLYEYLTFLSKNKVVKTDKYSNAIDIIDFSDIYKYSDYDVYILGVTQGKLPHNYKDEDFFSEKYKEIAGVKTNVEKRNEEISMVKDILSLDNEYFLSYYISDSNSPSSLIDEGILVNTKGVVSDYSQYSDSYNQIKAPILYEDYLKFGSIGLGIKDLYQTYNDLNFDKYDPSFKGVDSEKIFSFFKTHKLSMSHSSMVNFFECPFKYYLTKVLKVEPYTDNLNTYIGSLYHYVLEKCLNKPNDFEKIYQEFIDEHNYELSPKEQVFIENLKPNLIKTLDILTSQYDNIKYKKDEREKKCSFAKMINIGREMFEVNFNGTIDKIIYNEDTKELSVIDYKTSDHYKIELSKIEDGISIQLFIYLILLRNDPKFSEYTHEGLFFQNVLPLIKGSDKKIKNDEEYNQELYNSCLLKGKHIATTNIDYNIIKGKSEITKEDLDQYIDIVQRKIEEGINNIINGEFKIAPYNGEKQACRYCDFSSSCYKTKKNTVRPKND